MGEADEVSQQKNIEARLYPALNSLTIDAKSKIVEQIEFYFSDSNLPRDKFLRETVEADPERYVDIALLLTFSRLRTLLSPFGSCEDGVSVACVAALLEKSDFLTLSADRRRVRRTADLRPREVVDAEVELRSVYASPFPMTATIDDLTEFFSKHTKVLSIRLRRHLSSKDFKGSIFLELSDSASCAALIHNCVNLTYDGAPLVLMMKTEYLEKKRSERII